MSTTDVPEDAPQEQPMNRAEQIEEANAQMSAWAEKGDFGPLPESARVLIAGRDDEEIRKFRQSIFDRQPARPRPSRR